ncbi:MAG: hypothetical protein K0S01_1376 [Herbinix sp.]|jgi:uncharacterized protein YehS (DUF1456 family)|nr:hypothetical protein [Herbinix sp.]
MNNNDILIRIRYALDIKDIDMIEMFRLGGIKVTKDELQKMLIKSKDESQNKLNNDKTPGESDEMISCNNLTLESFLNGFIIFKRGVQEQNAEHSTKPALAIMSTGSVNNVVLKKMKIALALSSEDMLAILSEAGATVSKGELSAVFRKEGHKNYKECGDSYVRNFLKGLAIKYRQ